MVQARVGELRGCPAHGLISTWANAEIEGEQLDIETIFHEVGLFVAGGAETTRTAIAHGLRAFVDHPDQWELLHDEPGRISAAVEELLRWVSPLNNMFRTAVRDTDVHGQPIFEGERVALLYPAANRDPAAFAAPDRFDVTRAPSMHLAFGHGTHFCLGANLARLEVRLLLEELTSRITNLRPVTEPDVEPNVFARAVRSFDLGFDLR
jgi:cytochrome P450 family 142 subfamily A polypeptide 1